MSGPSNSSNQAGWPSWLDTTDHIGSHYPYYSLEKPDEFYLKIGDVIETIPKEQRELDLAGVLEVTGRRWMLGNRTLLRDLQKSPWMAEPDENAWKYHDVPRHGRRRLQSDQVVSELLSRLKNEVESYTQSASSVGVLLSGGLDSRIAAGVIRLLQNKSKIGSVTSYTWGIDECRDVHYARQIAEEYNWDFEHFELTASTLERNIYRTGRLGAEFSPIHLHALPEIRDKADVDVIIAGSYGNSIGRAEYAGDHVLDLGGSLPRRLNKFGVLRSKVAAEYRSSVEEDAYDYRARVQRDETFQYRETEQQLHYMRRLLQPCMTHVAEEIPLFQIFTSPDLVEYMWSLDPNIRGKKHCTELIKKLPGDLESIPNAKTGIPPNRDKPVDDGLLREHHNYGSWARNELRDVITSEVESDEIYKIFNPNSLNRLLSIFPKANTRSTNAIDELLLWIASLSIFIDEYDVSVRTVDSHATDKIHGITGPITARTYQHVRGMVRE